MAVSRRRRGGFEPEVEEAIRWRGRWTAAMLRKYAGKWVAIRGRRVIAQARTYDLLDKALEKKGWPPVLIAQVENRMVVY